jgi:uncharacterized protein
MTALVLIAKEPLPGRAKTRLSPHLSPEQAASVAAACIDDTAAALVSVPAERRILFFDGGCIPASASAFELIAQPSGTLDERLAWIFDHLHEPTILVGMDTPQLTAAHLEPALPHWPYGVDAFFGPATDGGFWALGMREPRGDLVRGVRMSRVDTGAMQRARLSSAGLRVCELEQLTDVDTVQDAVLVARAAPDTLFAAELGRALSARPQWVAAAEG